jgi:mono/diheme cytochrome c family protein
MVRRARIFAVGVVTLGFAFIVISSAAAAAEGDPKAGKARYDLLCGSCHGTSGKGDGPAAAALTPKPRDHSDGKYMNTLTDKYFFDIIKGGGASAGKSPLMPPWAGQLSDQDIRNLVAYIRSLAVPPYKPPK